MRQFTSIVRRLLTYTLATETPDKERELNMKLFKILTILFFSFVSANIVFADSMRCGSRIIQKGHTKAKVLVTCGEPILREKVGEKGSAQAKGKIKNFDSTHSRYSSSTTSSSTTVEKWTYNLGKGQFLRILTFEGGKLVNIELGAKP